MAKHSMPDWSAITDYTALHDAARDCTALDEPGFFAGPFRRFLEIGATPDMAPRGRARALELGRGALCGFRDRLAPDARAGFERRALDRARAWFADKPDGDYMGEVLEGVSNHNWRGPIEEETEEDAPSPPQPRARRRILPFLRGFRGL